MSEQEKFLERWSRRKQKAAKDAKQALEEELEQALKEQGPEPADKQARERVEEISPPRQQKEPAVFDPASLPPLDSITATTDIRAFLAPGVPEELKLEALRRVWQSDPAIRDFVGLSENSWDFNDPNGTHGFGPLEMTEQIKSAVEAMLDRKLSPAESESEATDTKPTAPEQLEKTGDETSNQISATADDRSSAASDGASRKVAANEPKSSERIAKRSHGAALPK